MLIKKQLSPANGKKVFKILCREPHKTVSQIAEENDLYTTTILMLTETEYNEILPHKADIVKYHNTGNCTGEVLPIADRIRQRMGMSPVCYHCTSSKAEAMNDMYNLMVEYENSVKGIKNARV